MRTFKILTDGLSNLPKTWVTEHTYVNVIDTPIIISGKGNLVLENLAVDDFWQVNQYVKHGDRDTTSQPAIFDPEEEVPGSVEKPVQRPERAQA